jgi:hypothetical protein
VERDVVGAANKKFPYISLQLFQRNESIIREHEEKSSGETVSYILLGIQYNNSLPDRDGFDDLRPSILDL